MPAAALQEVDEDANVLAPAVVCTRMERPHCERFGVEGKKRKTIKARSLTAGAYHAKFGNGQKVEKS